MKLLYLDIDGVLNDHSKYDNNYCGIKKECVDQLNRILEAVPDLQIVISSAWRYMIPDAMSLKGFEYLLLTHGLNCYGRLYSYTCRDEILGTRERQIKLHLMDEHKIESFAVLDDLPLNIKEKFFVRTNGKIGLTKEDADMVIRILTIGNY
jgi:hypothetical protein